MNCMQNFDINLFMIILLLLFCFIIASVALDLSIYSFNIINRAIEQYKQSYYLSQKERR
jgi:formate hydrogenlyase subunit 3/multisubunit Na+/H+ antiporter MnhD subunit